MRPGERQQQIHSVGCRQCATLWDEVCSLKRENAALTERLEQMEGQLAKVCWRRARHVGVPCGITVPADEQ